jgi:hypothetical protein
MSGVFENKSCSALLGLRPFRATVGGVFPIRRAMPYAIAPRALPLTSNDWVMTFPHKALPLCNTIGSLSCNMINSSSRNAISRLSHNVIGGLSHDTITDGFKAESLMSNSTGQRPVNGMMRLSLRPVRAIATRYRLMPLTCNDWAQSGNHLN